MMTDERTWLSAEMDVKTLYDKVYVAKLGQYELAKDGEIIRGSRFPKIKNVIFNEPATIVFWSDNTKTVVKCYSEEFDPEKGIAMAYAKKVAEMNGESGYYRQIKKWADKYWEQEEVREKFEDRLGKIMKDYLPFLALANNLNPPDVSD